MLYYFTLLFKSKIVTEIIYIFNIMQYSCIIALKMSGLLAVTRWRTYYK